MKLSELKTGIRTYLHLEDTGAIDALLATTLAFRLKLGDPTWLILVGVSSGGKSQLLRPLSLGGDGYVHKVDDLTENTLLSGAAGKDASFLHQMGTEGILLMSDLTVLFSKNSESRDAILAQLRMLYDGEITKRVGNATKELSWKGRAMLIAGATPSIYPVFQSVADMGERFIYYGLKPMDAEKAVRKAISVGHSSRDIDEAIGKMYLEYQKSVIRAFKEITVPELSEATSNKILEASLFAARLRTPVKYNDWNGSIERIPYSEMPMRVAKQLYTMSRGLSAMQFHESGTWELGHEFEKIIEWCAYSLADNERRAVLRTLANKNHLHSYKTQEVGDAIGLDTDAARKYLQTLAAIGIVERMGDGTDLTWHIKEKQDFDFIQRMEGTQNIEIAF